MGNNNKGSFVETLDATPKKRKQSKKTLKGLADSFMQTVVDISQFVFFATTIAGGYVLFTQGSVNMKVVGGIILAGGIYFFASKTISKQ
jgi:hypothetical protein